MLCKDERDLALLKLIGQRLKKEMKLQEITGAELSRSIGVTRSAISGIVTGRSAPSLLLLNDICKALNRPLTWLVSDIKEGVDSETSYLVRLYSKMSELNKHTLLSFAKFLDKKKAV